MALITAPASFLERMTDADISREPINFSTESIFNARRQVLEYPSGLRYGVNATFRPMREDEAGEWRAFKAKLRGIVNHFRCPMPGYSGPNTGYSGAAGQVSGGGQTGFSVITSGWANSTAVFRAGDYITIVNRIYMLVEDANSNGSGNATLQLDRPILTPPANSAPIEVERPYFLCAQREPVTRFVIRPVARTEFSLNGIEVLNPS